jgi:hypothetical protein
MSTPQETEKEKKLRLKKEEALQKLLRVKIAETQKIRERTEKRIRELRCEEVRILTRNKVKLDKLHLETQERIRARPSILAMTASPFLPQAMTMMTHQLCSNCCTIKAKKW